LAGAAGPSLEEGTKLVGWVGRVYVDAGEAVIYFVPPERDQTVSGAATDPAECARKAASRAKTKLRRYCKANRLYRMTTLSYAVEPANRQACVADCQAFIRRLRERRFHGKRFPYAWVIERGELNGRLHLHLALPRYVPQPILRDVWGLGHVWVHRLGGEASDVASERAMSARAAQYMAKYLGKSFVAAIDVETGEFDVAGPKDRGTGAHRYEVGQGFAPDSVEMFSTTEAPCWVAIEALMDGPASFTWSSDQEGAAWPAPPVRVLMWTG